MRCDRNKIHQVNRGNEIIEIVQVKGNTCSSVDSDGAFITQPFEITNQTYDKT